MKNLNSISLISFATLVISSLVVIANPLQHSEMMWGLKNSGQPIRVDLNPLQSYRIQSLVGQDIQLLPAVKGKKIKVAVVDTGIDTTHPDLKNFIYQNKSQCDAYKNLLLCQDQQKDANSIDCRDKYLQAQDNVYPGSCYGWSVLDGNLKNSDGSTAMTPNGIIGRPDFEDPAGHGTHVAGTILSVTENIELIPVQVIGAGPNQPIKPYSIDLSPNENIRGGFQSNTNLSERVARGIIYAMNSGAQVINMSLGWPEDQNSEIIKEAILEAQRRGIFIVAAAGNDSTSALLRPCQYKNVICVAAARPDGALASFSNFGFGVDIAAPGVEILSTIPSKNTSVRLPGFKGYDFYSGTSQATPYVSGVIAEMLSRGVPLNEIYPRLILGARPLQAELPVLRGPINSVGVPVVTKTSYSKNILSGLLDMAKSMSVQPQPLILPADKETQVIQWDRKNSNLQFQFKLKNYWKELSANQVQIQMRSSQKSEVEPALIKVDLRENTGIWKEQEERTVQVQLQIRDSQIASLSRLPSELSYQVYVVVNGVTQRQFEVKAEVITFFSKDTTDADLVNIPMNSAIPAGLSLSLVDEVYDKNVSDRDYLLIGKNPMQNQDFQIGLMKYQNQKYEIQKIQSIHFDGDLNQWRPKYKIRMDIDLDGRSEYVFGVIEYLDKDLGMNGPYRNHFYIFDDQMNLKDKFIFDDKRMVMPYQFYWMKINNVYRPAWVAKGPEIKSKIDITDLWSLGEGQNLPSKKDIRLYYLDAQFKLKQVVTAEDERIVDLVQPSEIQQKQGVLVALIAKNQGTPLKPSYINDFKIAEVVDGQLQKSKNIEMFNSSIEYRNLVDTFADKAFSLNSQASEYKATMWYGLDAHQKQRVTILDLDQGKMFDRLIQSQRQIFDAALQIRAGFQSLDRRGVFLMTNSEIEYHDLVSGQVAQRSLNRFSFYGENAFIELHSPVTLIDRQSPQKKLPALFTAEGTGLNRSFKLMLPLYTAQGKVDKMISPARFNFKSSQGCRALSNPVFMGQQTGYAIDYYCGEQIKRLVLKF